MATDKDKAPSETAAAAEVQKRVDQETEQGFRGIETDPTPNENYTVEGVTSGKPTPETDDAQADAVRKHAKGIERGDQGVI
jgi:hypothetical protein